MNDADRAAVREEVIQHAESVLAGVERRWGSAVRLDALPVEPLSEGKSFPASAEAFHDRSYPYAAGASVVDAEGRLLCVYSPARDEWETPGGAGEIGETPAEAARRETQEETGVACEITDLAWFGPDELPTELRNYEQKHAHLVSRSDAAND
jgi:hypothetical protein